MTKLVIYSSDDFVNTYKNIYLCSVQEDSHHAYSINCTIPHPWRNSPSGPVPYYNRSSGAVPYYNSPSGAVLYYNSPSGPVPYYNRPSGPVPYYNRPSGAVPYYNSPTGPVHPHYLGFTITLRHNISVRLLWTNDQPDAETSH